MSIHLEKEKLINAQQMEVAVHGPDGATHLILCAGVAELGATGHETYTFCVGPVLLQRQFVGVIASGAMATIQPFDNTQGGPSDRLSFKVSNPVEQGANLILLTADYDPVLRQVKVKAKVSSHADTGKLAISYHVSILAELPNY